MTDHQTAQQIFEAVLPLARSVAAIVPGMQLNESELRTEVFEIVVDNPEVTSVDRGRTIVLDTLGLEEIEALLEDEL